MAVLDVNGLTISYADKQLYNDASFQLEKHEHMGIVGQNGAGTVSYTHLTLPTKA